MINYEQSWKLYDVTGIIEPSNNLYYVPADKEMNLYLGWQVCEAFVACLERITPPFFPAGKNTITGWNPLDRRLVLKGKVDSFRKGSSSVTYNYIIIRRTGRDMDVENHPIVSDYYTGFFITKVEQSGLDSVVLELDEDDFTNVFYLHNNDTLKQHYRPFSASLKNAFIDRQHYDRFSQSVTYSFADHEHDDEPFTSIVDGAYYEINDLNGWKIICSKQNIQVRICDLSKNAEQCIKNPDSIYTCAKAEIIEGEQNYLRLSMYSWEDDISIPLSELQDKRIIINVVDSSLVTSVVDSGTLIYPIQVSKTYHAANLELFANTSDTLPYRFQQCIERKPVAIYKDGTTGNTVFDEVVDLPANFDSFNFEQITQYLDSLNASVRKNLISVCVKYIHIMTKERITIPFSIKTTIGQHDRHILLWYDSSSETNNGMPSVSQHLVIPFISAPKGYEKLGEYLNHIGVVLSVNKNAQDNSVYELERITSSNLSSIYTRIQEYLGYYIQSIYVTSYSGASEFLSVEKGKLYYDNQNYDELYCCNFKLDVIGSKNNVYISGTEVTPTDNSYQNINKYEKDNNVLKTYSEYVSVRDNLSDLQRISHFQNSLPSSLDGCMVFIGNRPTLVDYGKSSVEPDNDFWSGFQMYMNWYHNAGRYSEGNLKRNPDVMFDFTTQNNKLELTNSYYQDIRDKIVTPCILCANDDFEKNEFTITEYHNIGNNERYEPIMDFEPYTIQQLSFMLSGCNLNKQRMIYNYSDSFNVPLQRLSIRFTFQMKFNQVVSSVYKLGIVPYYKFDGSYYPYFNEQLLFVATEGLGVRSDSYFEFMHENAPLLTARYSIGSAGAENTYARKQSEMMKYAVTQMTNIQGGSAAQIASSAIQAAVRTAANTAIEWNMSLKERAYELQSNAVQINAEKASAARTADTYTDIGKNLLYDLKIGEYNVYRQKFVIDDKSYQSNCKMLERVGYAVNLYDEINSHNRIGWNYVKLASFDIVENELHFSEKQAKTIRDIFTNGVTLLHDKYLFETGGINKESYDE